MAGGRPSDYDPAFCDKVIGWGEIGKSKAWMASRMGVSRQTVENWCAAHPEFLDAMTRAMDLAQAWWEDMGQAHLVTEGGKALNSGVYSRSMAARFPADWREKSETSLTGADGGPVQIEKIERVVIRPANRDA